MILIISVCLGIKNINSDSRPIFTYDHTNLHNVFQRRIHSKYVLISLFLLNPKKISAVMNISLYTLSNHGVIGSISMMASNKFYREFIKSKLLKLMHKKTPASGKGKLRLSEIIVYRHLANISIFNKSYNLPNRNILPKLYKVNVQT